MEVYNAAGEQIGEIEDILIAPAGDVMALVIETEGFLGLGDKDVVVGLDQVELVGDRLVTPSPRPSSPSCPSGTTEARCAAPR